MECIIADYELEICESDKRYVHSICNWHIEVECLLADVALAVHIFTDDSIVCIVQWHHNFLSMILWRHLLTYDSMTSQFCAGLTLSTIVHIINNNVMLICQYWILYFVMYSSPYYYNLSAVDKLSIT